MGITLTCKLTNIHFSLSSPILQQEQRLSFMLSHTVNLSTLLHVLLGKNSLYPIKPPTKADNPEIITLVIKLVLGIKYSDNKTTIPTNRPVNKAIPILPFFKIATSNIRHKTIRIDFTRYYFLRLNSLESFAF